MKIIKIILIASICLFTFAAQAENTTMTRSEKADKVFSDLFASERTPSPTDPEVMDILHRTKCRQFTVRNQRSHLWLRPLHRFSQNPKCH